MCWRSATITRSTILTSWGSTEQGGRGRTIRPSRRHRRLIAALALTGALAAVASPAQAAAGPRAGASVLGGGAADPGQWPFAVAIFRKNRLHCGGSVIAPARVLTAAHCVNRFNLSNFRVIVGRPNLRNRSVGEEIAVASGRVHPDFEQTALHDVAVLNLTQPTSVPPVALATPAESAVVTGVGSALRVAGYGATRPFGTRFSPFLKSTLESVRNDRRCLKAYTRDLFAPESMICALGARRKKGGRFKVHTSACAGDSGGALVADTPSGPIAVGTVSFGGALCGLSAAPSVYSRVASSLDFINAG